MTRLLNCFYRLFYCFSKSHLLWSFDLLQRVSIACYAERCISYSKSVRPSVCLSVTRWHPCFSKMEMTYMQKVRPIAVGRTFETFNSNSPDSLLHVVRYFHFSFHFGAGQTMPPRRVRPAENLQYGKAIINGIVIPQRIATPSCEILPWENSRALSG